MRSPAPASRGNFWRAQVEAFSPHFKTVTFDHRGVGASSGSPPYAVEQWARDVVALLDHLDVGAAHLVGHSTGFRGAVTRFRAVRGLSTIGSCLNSYWASRGSDGQV
jgi:pimeloyl-ACP methyl ester carboxylesterase